MYRLGKREHSHRRFYIWLVGFICLVVALFFLGAHFLTANTKISKAPAVVTTKITYNPAPYTVFKQKLFSIGVPQGWKQTTLSDTTVPAPSFTWQGTSGDDKSRWINVYVDTSLPILGVNRALQIQSNGDVINVLSDTSDNCTSFTGVTTSQSVATAPAKWEGIDFLCDVGNYARDVVGTVSPDGLNTIILTGPTGGTHHYFFTYTDSSVAPDYTIFTSILKDFTAL